VAFSPEELAQLGAFVEQKVAAGVEAIRGEFQHQSPAAEVDRASVVGIPDVPEDAGPSYWVHLANGDVIESQDSASTHVDVGGVAVPVTGRYQIPAGYTPPAPQEATA
jgi:hypothetical protein